MPPLSHFSLLPLSASRLRLRSLFHQTFHVCFKHTDPISFTFINTEPFSGKFLYLLTTSTRYHHFLHCTVVMSHFFRPAPACCAMSFLSHHVVKSFKKKKSFPSLITSSSFLYSFQTSPPPSSFSPTQLLTSAVPIPLSTANVFYTMRCLISLHGGRRSP